MVRLLILISVLIGGVAHAHADTHVGMTAGGPPLMLVYDSPTQSTTDPIVMTLSVAFRGDTFTGVALEGAVTSAAVSGALLWDLIRKDRFILYARIGASVGNTLTVKQVSRDWDILLGGGMDILLKKNLSLVIDYRLFLPEPGVGLRRGEYIKPAYEEALHGGMLCGGLSFRF